MAMGVAHPEMSQQPPANPEVARFYVDLLSILQAKSKGNLMDSESRELEEALYQLRLRILDLQPAQPPLVGASPHSPHSPHAPYAPGATRPQA